MNADLKLQVQAYLDNEVSPAEARKIASLLSQNAEAQQIFQELKQTRALLVGNELPQQLREPRDFYFSQIRQAIEAGEKRAVRPASRRSIWMRFFAPVAGVVAILTGLISLNNLDRTNRPITPDSLAQSAVKEISPLHDVESTPEEVSAITFHSQSEGVTVVWVSSNQ